MRGRDITRRGNEGRFRSALLAAVLVLCGSAGLERLAAQAAPAPTAPPSQTTVPAAVPPTAHEGTQPAPTPVDSPASPPAQAVPASRQKSPADEVGGFVLRKEVDEVLLHATVVDDKQRIVTNLDRPAFTVLEDGKPQRIISFRHEDIPVAMGILIDNSGSMKEKRAKVNQAALNLVRASNPDDEVFIVNFNDEYYLDQDFTNDLLKLKEALEKIDARGGTALYEAAVASADHLKRNAKRDKKVLFIVTDGEDNASRETLEQAVKQLQQEDGPTVYAIAILGEDEHPKRAKRALEILAQRTGGMAFFPKTLDEVDEISKTIARDIRNQYTIGYKPGNPREGGAYRMIHVEAKAKGYGRLTVRTKSGYYSGPAVPATGQ